VGYVTAVNFHTTAVRFTRGMTLVSLAFNHRLSGRFEARFHFTNSVGCGHVWVVYTALKHFIVRERIGAI
jgi:hypothetical protein